MIRVHPKDGVADKGSVMVELRSIQVLERICMGRAKIKAGSPEDQSWSAPRLLRVS